MPNPVTIDTTHPEFQRPLLDKLNVQAVQGLQGNTPQFPGFAGLPNVYNPDVTQQFFQDAFVTPTMQSLTGRGGIIPRIGARQAQRGTFFSSGRQLNEAQAVSGAFSSLANTFNTLQGQDAQAIYQEWLRTQPTGQISRQAVNFLGTPMTTTQERSPSPWLGVGQGAAAGALAGGTIGLADEPIGALAGAGIGAGIGALGFL